MANFEEHDSNDAFDEEEIPDGLKEQWAEQEKEGRRAGVCKNCGWTFSEEQLSCAHCGEPVDLPAKTSTDLKEFFIKSPWGWVTILILALLLFSYLL